MSGCLSDDALTRVETDRATDAERTHLAACAACTRRARRARRDLRLIIGVLRDTTEPRPRPAVLRRHWWPAAVALSAAGLALLLWMEVALWRAMTPVPPTMEPQEVATILAGVSASLFSLSGDPSATAPAALPESDGGPPTIEAMALEIDHSLTGEEP